jgi:hypothetical protein
MSRHTLCLDGWQHESNWGWDPGQSVWYAQLWVEGTPAAAMRVPSAWRREWNVIPPPRPQRYAIGSLYRRIEALAMRRGALRSRATFGFSAWAPGRKYRVHR